MKFGEQLSSSIIKEYQWYYIDYDALKAQLKTPYAPSTSGAKGKRREWAPTDEEDFVSALYHELEKVYTKQKVKASEIARRISASEREVNEVVARLDRDAPERPTEDEFLLLEEDLSDIIADVHDLAKFVQLNYTGFQKIIKKHDKQTGWHLKPAFATQLKAKPFFIDNYDEDIIKLSKLYDMVRTRGNPVKGDAAAGGSQGSFVRNTTKYWVHPDNITELKLIILKHLPVLVFNASKEFDKKDTAITSIYYDNPETWDLYQGRLKKTEGAEAIRLRWYGGMDNETIFAERKTHREDWTGEKSVKARFALKEKNVNAYMKGELLPSTIFEKARKDGKKPEHVIAQDEQLAREIQYSELRNGYVPVCRSFYNRTAFQLPADARVRISLDTELTMVREDNLDGRRRAGDNWRRMDIGIDWPFPQLPPEDVERFPYAVLEVKLQTQAGQEPPAWVRELTASHLVEAVPKFSKFIHGVSTLFPSRISLLPYWAPQMHIDIRKPVTHDFGIRRPGQSANSSTSDDDDDDDDDSSAASADDRDDDDADDADGAPKPNEQSEESLQRGLAARDALEAQDLARRASLPEDPNSLDAEEAAGSAPLLNPYVLYTDEDDEHGALHHFAARAAHSAQRAGGVLARAVKALVPAPKPTVPEGMEGSAAERLGAAGPDVQERRFAAPGGKKIHVPVRVEPKVYFAAERTFLAWLEYSVYLGTIAVTLLNFEARPGRGAFLAAAAFTAATLGALVYSVAVYLWRATAIRERRAVKYHDSLGPSVLCGALLMAVLLNVGLEVRARREA